MPLHPRAMKHRRLVAAWAAALLVLAPAGRGLRAPQQQGPAGEDDGPLPAGGLEHVKDMIRHMLEQKTSDLTDSVSRKEFCSSETAEAKSQLKQLQLRLEKRSADRDRLEAELAELSDSTADMHADVADAQKAAAKEMEVRSKEHDKYLEEKRQYEHSAPGVGREARLKAETSEASSDLAFRRRQQEALELVKTKTEAAKRNGAVILTKRSELADADRDRRDLEEQVANVKEVLAQLDRQCIVRPEPYVERKRRRKAEIESLKDAYTILGG